MRRLDSINFEIREPHRKGSFQRGPHTISWTATGTPDGVPVIMSHGGPGGQNRPFYRSMFDPAKWYVIQIDQAGNGVSVPAGELSENTTRELVSDMETVRGQLGLDSWVVAGGSWGSALSLVYAQTHPHRTVALFLFCLWTARVSDLSSWFEIGRWVHPETYADVVSDMTDKEKSDPLATLIRRIQTGSPEESRMAATRLHDFEVILMNLNAPLDRIGYDVELYGRIFAHYISNNCFLEQDQILNHAARLADIPITIVQGRYDLCTPPKIAFDFLAVAPHAELRLIDEASHSPAERNLLREIVRAGEDIYRQLKKE